MTFKSKGSVLSAFIIVSTLLLLGSSWALLQSDAQLDRGSAIRGNVVHSKYLTITDHRYQSGDFSDTIAGTITNNSTQDIPFVQVFAALYDKGNRLITVQSGSVLVSSLLAGDNSTFTINIFGVKDTNHYTLFPGGTPL